MWKHSIDFHQTAYYQNAMEQQKREEVFLRFPFLCQQILSELENDYLTKCREVSRGWRLAIDSQSILMMQRYTKCSRTLLKQIVQKEDLVDLANQTRKLYGKYPITKKNRMTPLHEAARIGNLPILELIIENHEDINCRDGYGWTPLHWAAEGGHLEICQSILPLIKEKNPVDKYGKTAFDVALQNQQWKVCGLIIENNQENMRYYFKKSQALERFRCERFRYEKFDIENLRSLVIGKLPLCEMICFVCNRGDNYEPSLTYYSITTGSKKRKLGQAPIVPNT